MPLLPSGTLILKTTDGLHVALRHAAHEIKKRLAE
jgi:hypothetical protein